MRTHFHRGLAALVLTAFAACLLLCPEAARAAASMPHVKIDALVNPDGSLSVTEQRTFTYEDDVNGMYWEIPLGDNQQGGSTSVEVTGVSEVTDGSSRDFSRVASASNGDADVYTVESGASGIELKVYSPRAEDETATFSVSYTIAGAVMAWADTGELYWKFVGDGWEADSDDVELAVRFADAAASGVPATTGDDAANFRAWAHGPLDGAVRLDTATQTVTYSIPRVQPGEFAEARVLFPAAWVPGLAQTGGDRVQQVLDEEASFAEQANRRREEARTLLAALSAVGIGLPAVFLAVMVALKLKAGGKPVAAFTDTYFRDLPSSDHPAVIAAFMKGGEVGNEALVATLMNAADERLVLVERVERPRRGFLGGERVEEDYRMVVDPAKLADASAIDRAGLAIYLPDGASEVSFREMGKAAKRAPKAFARRWDEFREAVTGALDERGYVASTGSFVAAAGLTVAFVVALISLGCAVAAESPLVCAAGIVCAVVGGITSCTFKRLSQEGVELEARCLALKKWLEDFTRLGEAVPGDVVLWNKLLVMAVALGVSDRVLEELALATPPAYDERYVGGYYPSWWWYRPHGHMEMPVTAVRTANDLSLSALSSSSSSSAGGFGGGFSGGGGGGVGGGGGGTF